MSASAALHNTTTLTARAPTMMVLSTLALLCILSGASSAFPETNIALPRALPFDTAEDAYATHPSRRMMTRLRSYERKGSHAHSKVHTVAVSSSAGSENWLIPVTLASGNPALSPTAGTPSSAAIPSSVAKNIDAPYSASQFDWTASATTTEPAPTPTIVQVSSMGQSNFPTAPEYLRAPSQLSSKNVIVSAPLSPAKPTTSASVGTSSPVDTANSPYNWAPWTLSESGLQTDAPAPTIVVLRSAGEAAAPTPIASPYKRDEQWVDCVLGEPDCEELPTSLS